jgi:hypothetical protein
VVRPLRFVAPFRPFALEAPHHLEQPEFDWLRALREVAVSALARHADAEFRVITDVDTALPMPALQYTTVTRRLMLWYLEVCACYLESADFDRDTVMLDADQLVFGDLRPWLAGPTELGILIRKPPKGIGFPILNGVQFWPLRGKGKLAGFYREALAIAAALPEKDILWGADTVALDRLLAPLEPGLYERAGLRVRLIPANDIIRAMTAAQMRQLEERRWTPPMLPVLDFRNLRKPYMPRVFAATYGASA